MPLFRKNPDVREDVDFTALPRHVAIIMDGNGRWAKQRGLPRTAGHAAGAETFRTIATYCKEIGLDYLTVYAFSTENWKRPQEEVAAIMRLLKKYLLDAETGEILFELVDDGQEEILVRGGRGGMGNNFFKSATCPLLEYLTTF